MKSLNIEGISFSEEGIQFLKYWITPATKGDRPLIESHVSEIEKVQSFLLKNWDLIEDNTDDDFEMKPFLIGLQYVKEYLSEFKKGIKIADHE